MSISKSGRIVIEIDPSLKKKLYSDLSLQGTSLKDWFLESVHQYLDIKEKNIASTSKVENKNKGK